MTIVKAVKDTAGGKNRDETSTGGSAPAARSRPYATRDSRAIAAADTVRLGLRPIADRPARDTSLGEQQRTALARALVLGPAVAVLDEPTGHQDDDHVHLVLDVLAAAVRAGTLALVATHDPRVISTADVVVRMLSGRIAG